MNRTEFKAQIQVLRSLKGSRALDPDGLDWLERTFEKEYPDHLPLPRLDPDRILRGVFAKWDTEGYEMTLIIFLSTTRAYWNVASKKGNYDNGKHILHLCEKDEWDWLIDRLSYLLPKQTAEQRKELK